MANEAMLQTADLLVDIKNEYFSKESNLFKKGVSSVQDKIGDVYGFLINPIGNDGVFVPTGTKTLIGKDFTDLYPQTGETYHDTDSGIKRFIKPLTVYSTEMTGKTIFYDNNTSYNMLSDHDKAVYEITMLTKNMVSKQIPQFTYDENISDIYRSKLEQYETYCKNHNVDFKDVLKTVSLEFQNEACYYHNDARLLNFNVTTMSHKLLQESAGDKFTTEKSPLLEQYGLSIDDTMKIGSVKTTYHEFDPWDPHPNSLMNWIDKKMCDSKFGSIFLTAKNFISNTCKDLFHSLSTGTNIGLTAVTGFAARNVQGVSNNYTAKSIMDLENKDDQTKTVTISSRSTAGLPDIDTTKTASNDVQFT